MDNIAIILALLLSGAILFCGIFAVVLSLMVALDN
jgi:hypothetical protein